MLEEKRQRSVNLKFTRLPMPNAYASRICAGKIKDPSGVKRKDFRGRKPSATGGRVKAAGGGLMEATQRLRRQGLKGGGFMAKRAMFYGK